MFEDEYGLICQSDGDRNDQLQRTAMWLCGQVLRNITPNPRYVTALNFDLYKGFGEYVRYIGGDPDNVSADQLVPVLCYWVLVGSTFKAELMRRAMWKRFGFAQNKKDGLDAGKTKSKLPDFMVFRVASLLARCPGRSYARVVAADVLLVLAVLAFLGPVWRDDVGLSKRKPDDCDDNNLIVTLATCRRVKPTLFSWLAVKLYAKFRPWNYGCVGGDDAIILPSGRIMGSDQNARHPILGALRYYHRPENGGNFEFYWLYKPIVEEFFE